MDGLGLGLGSLCGAIIRASLRDANKCFKTEKRTEKNKNLENVQNGKK